MVHDAGRPHRSLTVATSSDDGYKHPTTERSGWSSLSAECGHRGSQPRKGDLECNSRQGRFRLSRCPPGDDQGMFSSKSAATSFQLTSSPGFCEQLPRLRRDRAELRGYLYSPWPGNEREENGRPQSVCVRGNKPVDDVG